MATLRTCASLLLASSASALFTSIVYRNGTEGYHTFRIPGLVRTTTGRLLALAEGRARLGFNPPVGNTTVCYGELASVYDSHCTNKDIVWKTSDDGGNTWAPVSVLSTAMANETYFYSNPQGLAEPASQAYPRGRVFLMFSRCVVATVYGTCTHVIYVSSDDAQSWQPVQETTCSLSISGVSGGIISHTNRYIFPDQAKGAIYSDAKGTAGSWVCGTPSTRTSENMIAIGSDGATLIMTIRGGVNQRSFAYSSTDGASWGPAQIEPSLFEPNCQGAFIAVNYSSAAGRAYFHLFANPHTNITDLPPDPWGRMNVTVQRSDDDARTWTPLVQLTADPSAYTALAQIAPGGDNSCGCLWEHSLDRPVDFLDVRFTAFDCATGA